MEEYFDEDGVGDDDNPDDIFLQDDVECDDLDDVEEEPDEEDEEQAPPTKKLRVGATPSLPAPCAKPSKPTHPPQWIPEPGGGAAEVVRAFRAAHMEGAPLKVLKDLHLELWTVLADAHLAARVWTEPSDDDEFIIDEELRCVVMGNPVYGAQADVLSSLRSVIRTLPQKRHRRR